MEARLGGSGVPPRPASAPPGIGSPWLGFSAVAVGTLMATLDGSIVNVALPTLRSDLHASFAGVEWVVASYLLVVSALLLSAGRLGDLLGRRAIYAGGLVVFTVGSGLCGAAPGLPWLVAARAVQAVGAAAMMAMGPAIVTALFPSERRGRALGGMATVVALGLTLGPPLGGAIIERLSWRWIFLPNLPIGVLGVAWALRSLPAERPPHPSRLDVGGALLLAGALGSAIAAIQQAGEAGLAPLALAAAAIGCAWALVLHVRRAAAPVLEPALFTSHAFSAGVLASALSYASVFVSNFLTPFFLAQVKGLSAGQVGAMLTVVPVALTVSSPVAGWLSDRFGPRLICPAAMAVVAAGLAWLAQIGLADDLVSIAARLAVIGFGMGLFQAPNNSAVMGTLSRERLGAGSGTLATARNLGMVMGIALGGALLRWRGGAADTAGPFLAGYRAALLAGAVLAIAAGVASLAREAGSAGRRFRRC